MTRTDMAGTALNSIDIDPADIRALALAGPGAALILMEDAGNASWQVIAHYPGDADADGIGYDALSLAPDADWGNPAPADCVWLAHYLNGRYDLLMTE